MTEKNATPTEAENTFYPFKVLSNPYLPDGSVLLEYRGERLIAPKEGPWIRLTKPLMWLRDFEIRMR